MNAGIGGVKLTLAIESSEEFQSRHTGAMLRRIGVRFSVRDENEERIEEALSTGGKQVQTVDDDGQTREWLATEHSYSYDDQLPRLYQHTLVLEELEALRIMSLQVGGLVVKPCYYEEGFEGERLHIATRAIIGSTQHAAILDLSEAKNPVSVVREGISDEPRPMSMSLGIWSQHDDQIKVEIDLVDPTGKEKFDVWSRVALPVRKTEEMLAETTEKLDRLVSLLVDGGVVSVEAVKQILEVPEEAFAPRMHEFSRVSDLDEWETSAPGSESCIKAECEA